MKKIILSISLLVSLINAETFKVNDTKSFRKALEYASLNGQDDIIELDKGVYKTTEDNKGHFLFKDEETFGLIITSKKDLKKEEVILDGDGLDKVLTVISSRVNKSYITNLQIKNISIKNGNNKIDQYSIETSGGISILGDYFENILIENVLFENNIVKNGGSGAGMLFNYSTDDTKEIIIKDCIFKNNKAIEGARGGALAFDLFQKYHKTNIKVINTVFEDNYTDENAGAVYFRSVNVPVVIEKTLFKNNKAKKSGGAIYYYRMSGRDSNLIIKDSTFIENEAFEEYKEIKKIEIAGYTPFALAVSVLAFRPYSGGEGGAIHLHDVDTTIINSKFERNKAKVNGIIYIEGKGYLSVMNSDFFDNNSENISSLIFSDSGFHGLYIFNSKILNNGINNNLPLISVLGSTDEYNKIFVNNIFDNKSNIEIFAKVDKINSEDDTKVWLYKNKINENKVVMDKNGARISLRYNNEDTFVTENTDPFFIKLNEKMLERFKERDLDKFINLPTVGSSL